MAIQIENISALIKPSKNGQQNGDAATTKATPLSDSSLEVEVVKSAKQFSHLEHAWNQLLDQPGIKAHIYQTFDWQYLWWKNFGDDHELHILTVWNDDDLVGIAPFFVEKFSMAGVYEYKKLKFIGSMIPDKGAVGTFTGYSMSDYLDVISHPDYEEMVATICISYLNKSRHLFDQIELNELPDDSIFMNHVLPKIEKYGWTFEKKERDVCLQIQLPKTMEECLDEMHSKARYELRYSRRAVNEKELFSVYKVENKDQLESDFKKFVELHQNRWNRKGHPGVFINRGFEKFLKEVGLAFLKRDKLNMTTAIDKQGNCIAVDFALQFQDRVYEYQKAFDDQSDLAKYSPGKALTYFLIENAINDDTQYVDMLRGAVKYKSRMTNSKHQNWKVIIPGVSHKNGLKRALDGVVQSANRMREQINRELLLLKVHVNEWGFADFMPRYYGFIKKRIEKNYK